MTVFRIIRFSSAHGCVVFDFWFIYKPRSISFFLLMYHRIFFFPSFPLCRSFFSPLFSLRWCFFSLPYPRPPSFYLPAFPFSFYSRTYPPYHHHRYHHYRRHLHRFPCQFPWCPHFSCLHLLYHRFNFFFSLSVPAPSDVSTSGLEVSWNILNPLLPAGSS